MTHDSPLPRLSSIDFFRFNEDLLIEAVGAAFTRHFDEHPECQWSVDHQALLAWTRMAVDVPNGGFTQFFFNHRGDHGVAQAATVLDHLELPKAAAVLRDALAIYSQHQAEFEVANPWDGLFGSIKEFDKLDKAFNRVLLSCTRALEKWIRSHIRELATDEIGRPIDVQFTGTIEITQPNGLVGESLEVKKGKPNGAYRKFFDDGTVRNVIFYKSGKVSGDFWRDGNLKRKESKRGNATVIEWFYPGGQLQKRYVKGKEGYAVEPTCLYYENGQLAEQVSTAKGKKLGPWLKFFEDGSPQLRAEFVSNEQLIIHDAWNEERTQVVQDGSGRFHGAKCRIDWPYDVFFPGTIWLHDAELKDGLPHGKTTAYQDGVLWSVTDFVMGVKEGESTTYWPNGRIWSVTKFTKGVASKTKSFPKFVRPVPAVVLNVEANEKLYTAWEHMPVNEYPCVLNLEEIRNELQIPDFLREVYERHQAGTRKTDYEDVNLFNDGIAYFLKVNEVGEVTSAFANGSGVYSGGHWDTYLPLLRALRFTPGRIRGRAVECRVLARVDHTFVEDSPQ